MSRESERSPVARNSRLELGKIVGSGAGQGAAVSLSPLPFFLSLCWFIF